MDNPQAPSGDIVIDLTDDAPPIAAHRLAELVQALTGCSAERAELALDDPAPTGPVEADAALTQVARSLVQLRSRQLA